MKNIKSILIVVAVQEEANAIPTAKDSSIKILVTGVGPIAAAAKTTAELSKHKYDLIINAGIAGAISSNIELGSLVLSNSVIAADLGVILPKSYKSISELGYGTSTYYPSENLCHWVKARVKISMTTGPILTVASCSGSNERAYQMKKLYPDAIAEAMEGFGVAYAASLFDTPFIEIRAISNYIGDRNLRLWEINLALRSINKAFDYLIEGV